MSRGNGKRRGSWWVLGVSVLVVAGLIGYTAYGWWDARRAADMSMRQGVERLDSMLDEALAGIDPPINVAYGLVEGKQYDTGLNDEVDKYHISQTGNVSIRISPAKAGELLDKTEAHWKRLGYRTTRPSTVQPVVRATTMDGSEIQLEIASNGRATVRASLGPYVHRSVFTRPSGAPSGDHDSPPVLTDDPYWSR